MRNLRIAFILAGLILFTALPAVRAATAAAPSNAATQADIAKMSDEEVRAKLIDTLNKEQAAQPKAAANDSQLSKLDKIAGKLKTRLQALADGMKTAPDTLPAFMKDFEKEGTKSPLAKTLISLVFLSIFYLGLKFAYKVRFMKFVRQLESPPDNDKWSGHFWRLLLRAFVDLGALALIAVILFSFYFLYLHETANRAPLILAFLAMLVGTEIVRAASRFLLAPASAKLRLAPISDETAQYLFHWIMRITWTAAIGVLVSEILIIRGKSEAIELLPLFIAGIVIALELIWLVVANRGKVAESLAPEATSSPLQVQLASVWHLGAITYVLLVWAAWSFYLLIGGAKALYPGFAALMTIPLILGGEYAIHQVTLYALRLGEKKAAENGESDGTAASNALKSGKVRKGIRTGVRISWALAVIAWLLHAWGFTFKVGEAVSRAGFSILVTCLLAYAIWVLVSNAIERKLGDDENGGRLATLLELLKKFLFITLVVMGALIILSALGIDVGPLMAGAGVLGVAIGFGSQALVKDIVSGLFFLIDDAFRLGDYIECGSARGTVEHISIRSLRIRHPRGRVYNVPFGQLKQVVNYSRDWAIMKLEYRVPYDADVDKIKDIVKEINKEISKIEEFDGALLDKIKSQGVYQIDDSGLIMRIKFTTVPGAQYSIRKLVYMKLKKKFEEQGMKFAPRKVTIHMPENEHMENAKAAAAAAAGASLLAEEEEQAKAGDEAK